jgi:O-antigen/teichoic acid export membrane protein
MPKGWRPEPQRLLRLARANLPLAGADAVEWGSRRLDIAFLGWFYSPAIVGIYYVAQQVASLPQKLKTTFDPILGPVISQNLAEGNKAAVGRQVRQVGFWIIAAQVGVAIALAIPGKAVMGLVGSTFVGGTGALAILLAAEAVAATAVVSEAALIYIAPKRNLLISLGMILLQFLLSILFVYSLKWLLPVLEQSGWLALIDRHSDKIPLTDRITAAGPAVALLVALGFASVVKSRLLGKLIGQRVSGWRWALVHAAAIGVVVGWLFTRLPQSLEWVELAVGIPAILGAYGWMIWKRGFTHEDRVLFRRHPDLKDLTVQPPPAA